MEVVEKSVEAYRENSEKNLSNLLKSCCADEYALALRVLSREFQTGDVEFFCGSGVGRDVTGVNWVELVNMGAEAVLLCKASGSEADVATALRDLPEFQLLQRCYKAYGPDGSDELQDAVVKSFNGCFLDFVMDYAESVDVCLVRAASLGFNCPKTYNIFIAEFMSDCHAKAECPASLPRSIGTAIARHTPHHRNHSMYTTNYSRSTNFALLEQGIIVEEIYPARMNWQRVERQSSAYACDMRVVRSVLYPAKSAAGARTVRVFHLHGIAKAREEFENPSEPGPKGRPEQLWARQEHFDLGSAESLMEGEDGSASLLEPWGRVSDAHKYRPGLLSGGRQLTGAEAADLFEAVAEGIVITRAQYGCKAHSEVLKGSFRLAMDDLGRTICLAGCSMSDEFFERFLMENLDANDDDEGFLGQSCSQGITLQLGVRGVKAMMDGDDVKAELKPYLLFFLGQTREGKPDFGAIQSFIEASSVAAGGKP